MQNKWWHFISLKKNSLLKKKIKEEHADGPFLLKCGLKVYKTWDEFILKRDGQVL